LRKGSHYRLTWDMVDFRGRMLDVPRTKNEEPIHVPLNDAAVAALRVVHHWGDERACVPVGKALRTCRKWGTFGLKTRRLKRGSRTLAGATCGLDLQTRLRIIGVGATLKDVQTWWDKSLTMTRRYAHLGPNKLHAVVSLPGASVSTSAIPEHGARTCVSQTSSTAKSLGA
jgi:integrase